MTETEYVWLLCNVAVHVTHMERLTVAEKRRIIQTRQDSTSR